MYKNILISTDGSELAQKGVEHGFALGKKCNSKITVINVMQPYPLHSPATMEAWSDAQRNHAEEALAAARAAAEKHGVTIETHQATNDSPAEAILEAATASGCDLIVMASHGRRGVRQLLLGSQTAEVVSCSEIPVLVVR